MSDPLDLAIAAYHDATLDAAGAALLATALRGPDAAAVRERMALDGLLGQAFANDAAVVRSVTERVHAERSASALVRAVRHALPRRPRRPRRSLPGRGSVLALAALLAVAVGAGWWSLARPTTAPVECRVGSSEPLTVRRGAASVVLTAGDALLAGDRLTVPRPATLRWADGSHLVLGAGSEVALDRPCRGPGCRLLVGTATAVVAAQPAGAPFALATPETRIEVLGTRFRVVAAAGSTRVDLDEGLVRLTRASDQRALVLQPEEFAVVAAGEDFTARRSGAPAAAAVTPSAGEPAWEPLFAASGLAGWNPQHGHWVNRDGQVHGHDPHGGKARLLGRQPFADLELRCRLRVTGAEVAEVQVGDYNWFAEIRSQGGGWVQVEVRQRGEDLAITADGVALPLRAGDGRPMRAGPLGFYVMPGGTLEIADARFRIPTAAPVTR